MNDNNELMEKLLEAIDVCRTYKLDVDLILVNPTAWKQLHHELMKAFSQAPTAMIVDGVEIRPHHTVHYTQFYLTSKTNYQHAIDMGYLPADHKPFNRYPAAEGQPDLVPRDPSPEDLQDQDRALEEARRILSPGKDLPPTPWEAGTIQHQALVNELDRQHWRETPTGWELKNPEQDLDEMIYLHGIKRMLWIALAAGLIAIAILLTGCATREAPEERVTISYELTTGTRSSATWELPQGAEINIHTHRGETTLHWRKGQSMWGTLKHNVVDYEITDRRPTGDTYVNEDATRQDLIIWIGVLVMLIVILSAFWWIFPEIIDRLTGKVKA
jgi:hypothetical protein